MPALLLAHETIIAGIYGLRIWPALPHLPRQALARTGRGMQSVGDVALNRLVGALRDPLTLDPQKAEWVADQLLQAGEHGILLPVNVILDAYVRGKARCCCRAEPMCMVSHKLAAPHVQQSCMTVQHALARSFLPFPGIVTGLTHCCQWLAHAGTT